MTFNQSFASYSNAAPLKGNKDQWLLRSLVCLEECFIIQNAQYHKCP